MAKKAEKKSNLVALETAPDVATVPVEHGTGGTSIGTMLRVLGKKGLKTAHAGGVVPKLRFEREGASHLVRYLGRTEPENLKEGQEFELLNFEVLNPEAFPAIEVLYKGDLVESWALKEYYSKAKPGDIAIIAYHGEVGTSRGQNDMKSYEIISVRKP